MGIDAEQEGSIGCLNSDLRHWRRKIKQSDRFVVVSGGHFVSDIVDFELVIKIQGGHIMLVTYKSVCVIEQTRNDPFKI